MNDNYKMGSLPDLQELGGGYHSQKSRKPSYASPLSPEKFMVDEDIIDRDYTYLRQTCPSLVGKIAEWIEDECDRQEYEGSFLYDERPDKTTLWKMAERIAAKLPPETSVAPKDLIHAMLCDEILYRRCRYYRKKKLFQ